MNIAVFCGSSMPHNKEIVEATAALGRGENAEMKQQIKDAKVLQILFLQDNAFLGPSRALLLVL
jgi:hypothetical protein